MEFHLYASKCVYNRFEFYDLAIVRTALRQNSDHGITGFLHRNETHYFQYIEGEPASVARLLTNLRDDHRHQDFETLLQGHTQFRRFAGWSMGFSDGSVEKGGITAADSPKVILNFLFETAQNQRRQLGEVAAPSLGPRP